MPLTPLAAMVRKDLLLFFSDRRAVIVSFVVPIAIAMFFGSIFSGIGAETERARIAIAVVDRDGSAISKGIVAGLQDDRMLRVTSPPETEARDAVRAGRTSVGVIIPQDFGERAASAMFGGGAKPEVGLIYDPSRTMELAVVRGVMTEHVMQAVAREAFGGEAGRRTLAELIPRIESSSMDAAQKQLLLQLLRSAQAVNRQPGLASGPPGVLTLPYAVHEEAMTGANAAYNGYAHSFAGMGIQFLLFAMANLGVEMLLERQRGLWRRLRSAPVSRYTLLAGKAISGSIISLLVLLVCFGVAIIAFHVRIRGSVAGFLGVAVACSLMASTFGLLVAALGNSPATARGVTSLAVLLMVMLGGAWVPTFVFPAWAQQVTLVVPVRWAVDGFDAVTWRGIGLGGVLAPMGVLLAFAAAFAAIAASRFRWEES